ncbi:carboxylating nicotinate-nucleotide diphosphorylase [Stutzerimonas nitrititolerans]|uniref:carboxylating nicotinate-nucleotide diphosphorylase n=1 Tax=Stutzerimonas nitrititolerans TaxID=2482751 RepID=UPI00289911B2|nr:carboxylating nicotinate-nucleotide diphosphorylase [Stutzerimonas nitrititolerans]
MHDIPPALLGEAILANVQAALAEDIGTGDITAQLIPTGRTGCARVISREKAVLCGTAWADEAFRQVDPGLTIEWHAADGDAIAAGQLLLQACGPARSLLSAERTVLNFLQLLSGIATRCSHFQNLLDGTGARLLDTRKTLPGLRLAEKYAVRCGNGHNHRLGLYDAFLIKENHIAACGGIAQAVASAQRLFPQRPVEVEVETLDELHVALTSGAQLIMLDNFSLEDMRRAVAITAGRVALEASGGINEANLRQVAETGVDYISLGTLTKDVKAIDLSMRLVL